MYLIKTPEAAMFLWPSLLWRIETDKPVIYLTFDDGPTPGITDWVLEQLNNFGAQASFFCLGKQVEKHPEIFDQIKKAGHTVGNHSYSHLNGRKVGETLYLQDIQRAADLISSPFFRPPYGRLTRNVRYKLQNNYRIVMWDILTGDFDTKTPASRGLEKTVKYAVPGSIVVCHDSVKASDKLKKILPAILEQLTDKGFEFQSLPA